MPQEVLLKVLELVPESLLMVASLNTWFRNLVQQKKLWRKYYKSINLSLSDGEFLGDSSGTWKLNYVAIRPYNYPENLRTPKEDVERSIYGEPPRRKQKTVSDLLEKYKSDETGNLNLTSQSPLAGVARYDFFVFCNPRTVVDGDLLLDLYPGIKHLNCDFITSSPGTSLENVETLAMVAHLGKNYIPEYDDAKGAGMFGERIPRATFPHERGLFHLAELFPNMKRLYIRFPWVIWSDSTSKRDPEPVAFSCRYLYSIQSFANLTKLQHLEQVIVEQIRVEMSTSAKSTTEMLYQPVSSEMYKPRILKLSFKRMQL